LPRGSGSYDWMVFVDGENFTIRGQSLANQRDVPLEPGAYWLRDVFLWVPSATGMTSWLQPHLYLATKPLRAFYYTAVIGDDCKTLEVRESLRSLQFEPVVVKKPKSQKHSKGVDISLAKDMLVNAFHNNYDVAVLYAGDGDFVPLVEEVKRMGKVVYGVFFSTEGLSDELRLACDSFTDITDPFLASWRSVYQRKHKQEV